MVTLNAKEALDKEIFQSLILDAAESQTPVYICDIESDPDKFEQYCAEGRMRAEANARMRGKDWKASVQKIPGIKLTADEIGRAAEGPIEEMVGLDVAAVLADSTDDRPDVVVEGVRFDVKGATVRANNTFAVPHYQVLTKGYNALLLVQHIEPGKARVWCVKCSPGGESWTYMQGVRGNKPFWRIACPMPV